MAPLLLFVFVFASQLMAGFNAPLPLPPPSYGNHTTILSIDGGGIRGIIPAAVLDYLDKALKAKDPTTSLAHYFDVISGTSTGGLMTAMLAAPKPSDSNLPLLTPSQVVEFYKIYGPEIFKFKHSLFSRIKYPKYDGEYLRYIVGRYLKETWLNQTLTNVVIPTFDERKIKPVIFSNYKLKTEKYLNAKLSDICLGTSAAPTYLPPYQFKNDGVEFDLVDGAMAANNPALVAVSEVIQHSEDKEILLLSLGTGTTKNDKLSGIFDSIFDSIFGNIFDRLYQFEWIFTNRDVLSEAMYSTNMIHYYLATVFPGVLPADNYLRIEEYNLDPSMEGMDNADKKNMDNLEMVGKNLLKQNVFRMNVNTFVPVALDQTNEEALDRLADKLYAERQLRLKRKSMEKAGSSIIESAKVSGRIRAT